MKLSFCRHNMMDGRVLLLLASVLVAVTSAWSIPYYPVHRGPLRVVRYAPQPPPHFRPQIHHVRPEPTEEQWERPKRDHHDYEDHDHHDHDHKDTRGVTGPVHTFVKTDKNANYKWGVRHHVGNKYAS
ncbi:uncharacterized protein LOC135088506 [Ostrinia nubilalis]|uniref:uncharacterized protein LOC135088506 n=1 Tax=Ostrinia nubilalis TaxID=29057 RepID=UPI0030823EC5